MKIIFDRSRQNTRGSKIAHPDLYHQRLMLKLTYAKACEIMMRDFYIRFYIEID